MPRTNQRITLKELRVGLFIFAGLLVLGFLILNSTGDFNPFEKRLKLRARFISADGLRKNSDVNLAGVSIGKVEDINFLPSDSPDGQQIEATFSVVKELDNKPITELIRTDSTAQLVSTSVLGNDKMINISPGTAKGTPVAENHVLKSSSAISINQLTATGNDLLQQINKIAVPANEILNKANNGEGTLGRIINDETLYKNIDSTVVEAKTTMSKLQDTIDRVNRGDGTAGKLLNDSALYDNINKTVTQLEAISTDLRNGRGTAGKLFSDDALYNDTRAAIADLRNSVSKINSVVDDFKVIAADLNQGKGTAGRFLKDEKLYDEARDAIAKFNATTTRIDTILSDAQAGKGTIGRLVTDETLYNSINQTASNVNQFTSEGTKLLYDFRQNPKKFLRIKLSLF